MRGYLLLITLLLVSCGKHTAPLEDHGDIIADGNFVINVDNHPRLYGEKNCFMCHQEFSIHQEDRINGTTIDLESIQNKVKANGIKSCSTCHGSNDL